MIINKHDVKDINLTISTHRNMLGTRFIIIVKCITNLQIVFIIKL